MDETTAARLSAYEKSQALMERDLKHHVEVCGDRYKTIESTTKDIREAQTAASLKMDSSVQRLHTRQDETNSALASMKTEILVAIEHGKGETGRQGVGLKVWVMGGMLAAIPTAISIIAFIISKGHSAP